MYYVDQGTKCKMLRFAKGLPHFYKCLVRIGVAILVLYNLTNSKSASHKPAPAPPYPYVYAKTRAQSDTGYPRLYSGAANVMPSKAGVKYYFVYIIYYVIQ